MDGSNFDYENFEEISIMGDVIDKIEANDIWNETINEMIRRGDAVRRPDGKIIFADQVPDFDIVEDIASYTKSDIKSAEAEKKNCGCGQDPCVTYGAEDSGRIMVNGRINYDWETEPENMPSDYVIYGDVTEVDEKVRKEIEDELYEGKTSGGMGAIVVEEDEEEYQIYYNYDPLKFTGVNKAETFEAPLAGAGATMDITKDSSLSSFTPEELTSSSAIHGDFDHASLNYSGHQNIEARAESEANFPIDWKYAHESGATVPKYYRDDEELPIYKYFLDSATAPYHLHGLDTFYMPEGKDYYWDQIKEKFMPADYRINEKSEEMREIHWQEEADWETILNDEFVDELYEKWLANHEFDAVSKIAADDPDWAIQNESRLDDVGYFAEETIALVQPNFWMDYPITGMLAVVGLFAIGKTLLNSRKEES